MAEEQRNWKTITASRTFAKQVKVIAAFRGVTIQDAIDTYAGAVVAAEYQRVTEEMVAADGATQDIGGEG